MVMMASLFFSRAILSLSMMVFVLVSFIHKDILQQFRKFLSTPLLWSICLLFLLPLISGLWSNNLEQWLNILRLKLPLLMLPVAFASPFHLSGKQWKILALLFTGLVTAGTAWSLFYYSSDMVAIEQGYLRSKSIITPLKDDHVRFSWMVSLAALLAGWLGFRDLQKRSQWGWLYFLISAGLIIYLHVLAARTGLLSFYIILFLLLISSIYARWKPRYSLLFFFLLIALPVTAYFSLPTLRNRVTYFKYDQEYFKDTHYLPGGNDAVRVISLKAGWEVLNANKITGVGFGDINDKILEWYHINYPGMKEDDKIYPSSEWLVYGTGCGWVGVVIFTMIMMIPFFEKTKERLLWWGLNLTAAFSFLFDIGLEVQFGVFLYAFCVLWWWKWLISEKM
jgi:hypothetical protein